MLVADASKFARSAPVRICEIGDLSAFVTDAPPPERFTVQCEAKGIDVIVADQAEQREPIRT